LLPVVEGLFGAITFVQLCVSVMVFCTTGFVLMTKEYDNFFLFLSNVIYFSLMLFKILMCCFVGNDLIYAVIGL
jgi:7tm Odorant receptor